MPEAHVGFAGVLGDRIYGVHQAGATLAFPYLTARSAKDMLRFRPRFRHPERTLIPRNLADAEALGPGVTPLFPSGEDLALDIETPDGKTMPLSDPELLRLLAGPKLRASDLTIIRSDRAMTDCRPLSLVATRTIDAIGQAVGLTLDKRRFRANFYLDLISGAGFAEDAFVGRQLRIGEKLTVHVLERDPRCRMISIDPGSLHETSEILRYVAKSHDGAAGVYAAVLVEGVARPGDEIVLLD